MALSKHVIACASIFALAGCSDTTGLPPCDDVHLRIERVLELGRGSGSASPRPNATIVALTSGDHVTAPTYDKGTISVFGADGVLKRVVGRFGSGPGEYRDIHTILPWSGDSIAVVDAGNNRVTIITGDGTVGRTFGGIVGGKDFAPLRGGVLAAFMTSRSDQAGPIWVVGFDGKVARAFGRKAKPWLLDVAQELGTDGSRVYAGSRTQLRVDVYEADGDLVQSIAAEPDWFPGFVPTVISASRDFDEITLLSDLVADSSGIVLLLASRLKPDKRAVAEAQQENTERSPDEASPAELDRISEYFVQGIDTRRQCMAPVVHLPDGVFTHFPSSNALVSKRELDDGSVVLDMWRIMFAR